MTIDLDLHAGLLTEHELTRAQRILAEIERVEKRAFMRLASAARNGRNDR